MSNDIRPLTGHIELVYPSRYLKSADLRGRDVTVIIRALHMEALTMAGGVRESKATATLATTDGRPVPKRWVVGKTVLRQIGAACGSTTVEGCVGKTITIYPTTCKGKSGGEVECIRVRPRVNQRAEAPAAEFLAPPAPEDAEAP